MVYGEKFLTESNEPKIIKYKEILDEATKLLEIEYKWLVLDADCYEKIYPLYMSINEKNAENNYKEIEKIFNQNISKMKKIYDFEEYEETRNKLKKKISSSLHLYFTELPLLKNSDINNYKLKFKNTLNKIYNDTDKYYDKYKEYIEKVDYSKIYKTISKKHGEIYKNFPELFDKYDNPDGSYVEVQLDGIREDIGDINSDIKFYTKNLLLNRVN